MKFNKAKALRIAIDEYDNDTYENSQEAENAVLQYMIDCNYKPNGEDREDEVYRIVSEARIEIDGY